MKHLFIAGLLLSASATNSLDLDEHKARIKLCAKKAASWLKIAAGASTIFFHTTNFIPAIVEDQEAPFSVDILKQLAGRLWTGEFRLSEKAGWHVMVFSPYLAGGWLIADGIQDALTERESQG